MESSNSKQYDLESRTLEFAKTIIRLCKQVPLNPVNNVLINQLARAATSIGANYREANDALGKKDFVYRLRISRKETKETLYWLELIKETNSILKINNLLQECSELRNILSAIINKAAKNV